MGLWGLYPLSCLYCLDSEMRWYEYKRMLRKGQFCFKHPLPTLNFYEFPSLQRTLVQCNKNSIISIS